MSHKGCKHLDYETIYPNCRIVTVDDVKYWERLAIPYEGAPVNVQFCGDGRGRINSIFDCIFPGRMPCFEAQDN